MKTLFLNPPSFEGFDGGAGSRYQATREVRSFWYPTWLCQAAALIPDSRVVDGPADDLTVEDVLDIARDFEMVIIYTSTPSFANDAATAGRMKEQRPDVLIGFVGPHVNGAAGRIAEGGARGRFCGAAGVRVLRAEDRAGRAARRRSRT